VCIVSETEFAAGTEQFSVNKFESNLFLTSQTHHSAVKKLAVYVDDSVSGL